MMTWKRKSENMWRMWGWSGFDICHPIDLWGWFSWSGWLDSPFPHSPLFCVPPNFPNMLEKNKFLTSGKLFGQRYETGSIKNNRHCTHVIVFYKLALVFLFFWKRLMLGRMEGKERRGWPKIRQLDGISDSMDSFEQTPGNGGGQRSLACCSPWGCKKSDIT